MAYRPINEEKQYRAKIDTISIGIVLNEHEKEAYLEPIEGSARYERTRNAVVVSKDPLKYLRSSKVIYPVTIELMKNRTTLKVRSRNFIEFLKRNVEFDKKDKFKAVIEKDEIVIYLDNRADSITSEEIEFNANGKERVPSKKDSYLKISPDGKVYVSKRVLDHTQYDKYCELLQNETNKYDLKILFKDEPTENTRHTFKRRGSGMSLSFGKKLTSNFNLPNRDIYVKAIGSENFIQFNIKDLVTY